MLLRRKKGTLRRSQNHGLGKGLEGISRDSTRHEPWRRQCGTLRSYLNLRFGYYEEKYVITPDPTAQLADRFDAIITTAYKQTGLKVAILIDEYDSPLQHSWKTPEHEACTEVYREVFAILKADDEYERLVFITGITKFTQISLFSVLNNLTNISFLPEYAAI